jgi:alpha-ketoglutaric semialdehyde dehydrogenase
MTVVVDPTTGQPAYETEPLSSGEAGERLAIAREAQAGWAALGALARAARLNAAAAGIESDAALVEMVVGDVGKPVAEARGEVARAAAILRYVASLSMAPAGELYEGGDGSQIRVVRVPRGVAVLITPWNFPVAIPVWKLAPALLSGNAVCLKPATQATRIAERIFWHLHGAGVPPEVAQVVPGGAEAASGMLDGDPDAVSFTGSTATGRTIARRLAGRFIPMQLEMGGKNALFVSDRADPGEAARIALAGAMAYAGQKCTATSVLLVHEHALDSVKAELDRQADRLAVGDPREEATVVGPMIGASQRDAVLRLLVQARDRGVAIDRGGDSGGRRGAFLAPTLVSGGSPRDPINREELFAPVLSLQPVADLDEAIARLDELPYGLVAGIVSPIRAEVEEFVRTVKVGLVRVNAPTTGLEPHVPFGGSKQSSFGPREQGRAGLEFFSETRTIYG